MHDDVDWQRVGVEIFEKAHCWIRDAKKQRLLGALPLIGLPWVVREDAGERLKGCKEWIWVGFSIDEAVHQMRLRRHCSALDFVERSSLSGGHKARRLRHA